MKNITALSIFIFFISCNGLMAQSADSVRGDAAFFFAYNPVKGNEGDFFEGYEKHLEWHRTNRDPLVWYGWTVASGDRLGMFVDATIGISFSAFDRRIKPGEDAAHFNQEVAPYAETVYRQAYKHQPRLGTSDVLEVWEPTPIVEAVRFSLYPGKEELFEEVLVQIAAATREGDLKYTVYRQMTGGQVPSYLMIHHRSGFSVFDTDDHATTLTHLIHRHFDTAQATELSEQISASVRDIYIETWLYRQNLSYFPGQN